MSTIRNSRPFAALAATALVAGGMVGGAVQASAAVTDAPFNCSLPLLGAKVFTVSADATFPAKVEAGKNSSYAFTAKVAIPDDVRRDARAFLGSSVRGTAKVPGSVGGQAVSVNATIPTIEIPATEGPLVVEVKGTGSFVAPGAGPAPLTVQSFETALSFTKDGVEGSPLAISCSSAAPVTIATVQVVKPVAAPKPVAKAASRTKVAIKKKGRNVTATVTVKAGKKAAAGKVKVVLKQGKKAKKVTLKLNRKGVARATFKRVAKGKFTITATYAGNATTKRSVKSVRGRA